MSSTERLLSGFGQSLYPYWKTPAAQKAELGELRKLLPQELVDSIDTIFISQTANDKLTTSQKTAYKPNESQKQPIPWLIAFLFRHPTLLDGNKNKGRIPAIQALRNNHPFLLNTLLKGHKPQIARWINEKDYLGETPLHTAVAKRHISEALRLIELGADPFVKNDQGQTVLDTLAEQGKVEQIKLVLSKFNAFKQCSKPAIQELEKNAKDRRTEIDRHKNNYQNLSETQKQKHLFELCSAGWGPETVPKIYAWAESGFNFNQRMVGEVPLYWAIENKKPAMAKALLRSGASPFESWPCGTLLDLSIQKKQNEILKEMLRLGTDIHALNDFGRNPVFKAIQYENYEAAELLALAGANVKEGLDYMKMWPDYGDYPKAIKTLEAYLEPSK